jgi:hypothetical protein
MKEITSVMYPKLYDAIHYKIEIRIHHSLHKRTNKYVPMVSIMRQLQELTDF